MVTSPAGCRDDLGLDDYRRIVNVMDTVAGATSHADLRDRLLRSLAREFGWTGARLLDGETGGGSGPALRIRVAAGPGVTATIAVPLTGAGPRERLIADRLGRLLGPSFRAHLAARTRPGDEWSLTEREREIAELVAAGMTNRQLAEHLHVTVDTVKKHLTSVLRKTGCSSRTRLAVLWRQTT